MREENSKSEIFLHTLPHSLFTFSCESFGLSCVCLVKKNFPRGEKRIFLRLKFFFGFFLDFFVLWPKFSRMVNKTKNNQISLLWSWLNWREVLKINFVIFSLQFKTRKIYIIIFFFRRKKENSKIPTFSVRERTWRKWEAKSVCCVRVAKEKIWENVFLFLFKKNCTIGIVNETFELREIVDEVKIRKKLPISYNDSTILEITIEKSKWKTEKWKIHPRKTELKYRESFRNFPTFYLIFICSNKTKTLMC